MTRIDHHDDPEAPPATSLVPAASAIVANDRGAILLHRRRDNDLWSIPGGAMEVSERIGQTVVREVEEETGLQAEIEELPMHDSIRLRIRHYLEDRPAPVIA
jgi:8-oxo-dGTP pyrophosphatase MutT (NUDIX family)